ncbi:MAG: fumarylacetoacetate hydrolase family protein [Tropicimonas sp.]|uniref:fumarylacetoacetate hydrolase family protein n=1 Tax=Tropicimonas sp. TaxID=2067044 RepID=UPI003A89C533
MPHHPLTKLLLKARQTGQPIPETSTLPLPATGDEADSVQRVIAEHFGGIGGYKVFQVGTDAGKWGAIVRKRISAAPAVIAEPVSGLRVEAEIAFRFARDLPARDGGEYSAGEVRAAIGGAFAAFEVLEARYPWLASPDPLLTRADSMTNWGLVTGREQSAWQPLVTDGIAMRLEIGGRSVVEQSGGHPSGNPAHPLTWLANALARTPHPIRAGDIVTTGAFGGPHILPPGETAVARFDGFDSIELSYRPG